MLPGARNDAQADTNWGANVDDSSTTILMQVNSRAFCKPLGDIAGSPLGMSLKYDLTKCFANTQGSQERILPASRIRKRELRSTPEDEVSTEAEDEL
jgi:hypothetical protein